MNKKIIITLFIMFFVIPSISFSNPSLNIPTSSRANKAIANVTPVLKKELAKAGLKYGAPIFIRIFKEENELEVWLKESKGYKLFKIYHICTYGPGGLGPKTKQGDGKAPEGFYYVKPNQLNPVSQFHLSFNLGYPNEYDRIHKRTGSALMVHGNCVSIGCYAMTDKKIEEIYTLGYTALKNGQKFFRVHIFPFRMTDKNMLNHRKSNWYLFWQNLKEGYDLFEEKGHIPPNVEVENGRYVF
ncbi:MAG: murein L,D-transpeptidase family protein [Pseudomonadota bacterium]